MPKIKPIVRSSEKDFTFNHATVIYHHLIRVTAAIYKAFIIV